VIVLPIMYTSTTMILVRFENNRKVFPSQTFEKLYEYAKSEEWEFGENNIDLTCLHLTENGRDLKETENKLIPITRKTEPVVLKLYQISLVYNKDQNIYVPSTYKVLVQNEDGTVIKTKVEDLKTGDNVLTKMFGNVTHVLGVLDIKEIGDYEFNETYEIDVEPNDIVSVGTESVEIYVCED